MTTVCACEIDRYLYTNQLSGTISTFIGQLTALTRLSVTIKLFPLRWLSVRIRVLMTAVCVFFEIDRYLGNNLLSGDVPAINAPALIRSNWYCLFFALSNLFSRHDLLLLRRCITAVCCKTTAWCVFFEKHDLPLLSCLFVSLFRMNHHQCARTALARRSCSPQPACLLRKRMLAYVFYITQTVSTPGLLAGRRRSCRRR